MRKTLIAVLLSTALYTAFPAHAEEKEALLQADIFQYDQTADIFTASGRVELMQDGQIVKADRMTYDRRADQVIADGNVVFVDKRGQSYFAKRVELKQKLKQGIVMQMGLVFSDGSRFAAREGRQVDENRVELRDAVYSPCNLCEDDPRKPPLWQLRAGKIVHDKKAQDVYYHRAKLEVHGVPVVYAPYISHPDPSVTARSGFLMPKISTDSKKGLMLRNYYYHTFSPQNDMTLELTPTQDAGTVLGAVWRQKFDKGRLLFDASINRSEVRGGNNDNTLIEPKDTRGHFFAEGRLDINEKWRAGFDVRRTTDDYYLRDFDYGNDDVLHNRVYAERFSGRHYAAVSADYFQDLRRNATQEQPDIAPQLRYDMTGDPNAMLGGRWEVNSSMMNLFRDGEHSVSRLSVHPSWERRDILPMGVQTTWRNKLRLDNYWVRKDSPFDALPGDPNINKTVARAVPSTQFTASYPLVRPSNGINALIEPIAAVTLMPNNGRESDIPNEDSRDIQVDISNLFNESRFAGYDRIETGSHVSYGVKFGGYDTQGNSAYATLGQSYRITDRNPFPQGSGLENNRSDLVGQIETTFYDRFYLDYRFQFNEQDLEDRRHELQAVYLDDKTELRTNYVFAEGIQGTGLTEDRHQIGFEAARVLIPNWSASVDSVHDLAGNGGLLKAGASIQYKNECIRLALRGERDLTERRSGGSDSRILFSIGLRNLGGYDEPLLSDDPLYKPFAKAKNL